MGPPTPSMLVKRKATEMSVHPEASGPSFSDARAQKDQRQRFGIGRPATTQKPATRRKIPAIRISVEPVAIAKLVTTKLSPIVIAAKHTALRKVIVTPRRCDDPATNNQSRVIHR